MVFFCHYKEVRKCLEHSKKRNWIKSTLKVYNQIKVLSKAIKKDCETDIDGKLKVLLVIYGLLELRSWFNDPEIMKELEKLKSNLIGL